jgi:hypothetical protein
VGASNPSAVTLDILKGILDMTPFENFRPFSIVCLVALVAACGGAFAQGTAGVRQAPSNPQAKENAEQVASILALEDLLGDVRALHTRTPCGSSMTAEELATRQQILEAVVTSSLEVDGTLGELESERARLFDLRAALASRRDRSLGLLNVANLVTGTGLGIAVNALQFSDSTAKVGDNIGIVSGIGSSALSVIGIRRQRGPLHSVGRVPNMLAQLFDRQPELNSYYAPAVLEYLHRSPAPEDVPSGSRLDQLMGEWRHAGRIGSDGSPKSEQQIARLTSSLDRKTKLSIDDISDRIAMLGDVAGRVGLMKRDLASLMRSLQQKGECSGR